MQESYKRMMIFGCLDDDDARYMDALATALTALRVPQPDPKTGLVPCGCGEKAMLIGLQGYSYECIHCGTSTRNYEKEEHAKTAWNTAMGRASE